MRVLFVYPNLNSALSISPSIGCLSAVLKAEGHSVRLVHLHEDLGFGFSSEKEEDKSRVGDRIKEDHPDLIGVTATTFEYSAMNELAAHLKRNGLKAPLVLGGAHATFCPEDFESTHFDAFCVGEGELPLAELCRRIDDGLSHEELFRNLPSFLARGVHQRRSMQPIALFDHVTDLDSLPRMDRSLFDMDRIVTSRQGWVDVVTARGCPFNCTYCCNNAYNRRYLESKGRTRGFRQRSVESVVEEIRDLVYAWGEKVRVISFQEDYLNLNRSWMLEFCEVFEREIGLPFYMCARPESIDERMATALGRARCLEVSLGIETGSERIRNEIYEKDLSNKAIRTAVLKLRAAGVDVFANIMVGAPTESRETLQETLELLADLKARLFRPTTLMPLRGTDLHSRCKEMGLLTHDDWTPRSLFDESILSNSELTSLELLRFRYLMGWKVNACMNDEASRVYSSLISLLEEVPPDRWRSREFLLRLLEADEELSLRMQNAGITHYRFFMGSREFEGLGHVKRFELWRP